ncbi:hypothetical protein BN1708_016740 [Verticillium longisporum]|uniref:Uncharacterized protein n=1 Tax=Verticillium longisporum TaxID=100787 RepID=A0A0G4N005_VERLO|nr:hypothetical protein BN1708_016740 [Verticillium longisporum]
MEVDSAAAPRMCSVTNPETSFKLCADILTASLSRLRFIIANDNKSCAALNNWGKNAPRVGHGKELVPEELVR